jgi:thermitase
MNQTKLASLLAVLGLLLIQTPSYAVTEWAPAPGSEYVKDQILVKFKTGVAAAARTEVAQTYGAQTIQTVGEQSDLVLANLTPGQTVEQAVSAYASDPNVEYAQPNYIYHALVYPYPRVSPPTDTQYGQLWAANNTGQTTTIVNYPFTWNGILGNDMNLQGAWYIQTDCSSVLVAVVDTGINYNATDLNANMWMGNAKHGQNFAPDAFIGAGTDPMDLAGHGTHVAGIIGAVGNNGSVGAGSVGVCWNAKLMAVRVLDAAGSGLTSTIVAGINYAVAQGAKIINMSLGGTSSDTTFSQAITDAQTAGVLVVVAAGNSAVDNDSASNGHWPCNYTQSNLICVAALDQNYALASFSDYGATSVDVGAPGTNIYSTWAGINGTITDPLTTGWSGTSTTSGGGWGATAGNLLDPKTSWGTALYNAGTDDRVWKSFNLTGYNAAILSGAIAINVKNGDWLNFNYQNTAGDPFGVSGVNAFSITNVESGTSTPVLQVDITPCISANCTVGLQLTSAISSARDFGSKLTSFNISTLTLSNTASNTISGTSMATPEVVGVAALVWAHNPSYTYADVANAIKNGGRSISALTGKTTTGKAVDALGALTYINPPTGIAVVVH